MHPGEGAAPAPAPVAGAPPQRIVSLAPALTSMLFRLGLGPQVVGVTRFCDDPPEAARLPRVGGFADADLEVVLSLRPDLVVAVESPALAGVLARVQERGVRTLAVQQDSLASTFAAFEALRAGRRGAKARPARRWRPPGRDLPAVGAEAGRAAGLTGRSVLFVYGRSPLVVAGPGSYGDELLRLLGARNAAAGFARPWPKLTAEEVVGTRPEVVLDAALAMEGGDATFWQRLPGMAETRVVAVTHPGLAAARSAGGRGPVARSPRGPAMRPST